jgi:hypothetical protein
MANVLFAGAPRSWMQPALKTAPRGKLPMRGKLPVFRGHVHAIAPNLDYYDSAWPDTVTGRLPRNSRSACIQLAISWRLFSRRGIETR